MMNNFVDKIKNYFDVTEEKIGKYSEIKAGGMEFKISSYSAKGLGHISVMTASGMMGLMKMETAIINPLYKDAPLFSYDRIHVFGKETLIIDLYNTMLVRSDLTQLSAINLSLSDLPNYKLQSRWYDQLRLTESIAKKGKKAQVAMFDQFTMSYLEKYLEISSNANDCSYNVKKEKAQVYVNGLLNNGGASTDVFLKKLGKEETTLLFNRYLFGTV